tara:strand:- start:3051 stop:3491 length:441 start_codon:yes stop_codon:yes gene_type:complete
MKKLKRIFADACNRNALMQRMLVDIALDAPKWIGELAHSIIDRSERGRGMLEDLQIYRQYGHKIRMHYAANILQMHGFKPRIDKSDVPCIWVGDDTIECMWDSMNGEPEYHPKWLPMHERNIDALVDKRELFSFIMQNEPSIGETK